MKNFHLPLPDDTYDRLRAAAVRSKVPATTLAREAIDFWWRHQFRKTRHDAIAAYAGKPQAQFSISTPVSRPPASSI